MSNIESISTAPVRKVKGIQFGVLDPDFIVSAMAGSAVSGPPRLSWAWAGVP